MSAYIYCLRTTDAHGQSYDGFQWPREIGAEVVAPCWRDDGTANYGLRGFPRGEGDGSFVNWATDALWWIVRVNADEARAIRDEEQVKFPRCVVHAFGTRDEMTRLMATLHPEARAIIGATVEAGDWRVASVGDFGMATAGQGGTATAGHGGTARAGDCGIATAGYSGTATAGEYGTAIVGPLGMAKCGPGGKAIADECGRASAGKGGMIMLEWRDRAGRLRMIVGYVGEGRIRANVPYRVDAAGKLVRADCDDA